MAHWGLRLHNTRHSAVTNLVDAGTSTNDAMAVSGHRTRSIFDRYKITPREQTRSALRRVTDYTAREDKTPTVIPSPGADTDTLHGHTSPFRYGSPSQVAELQNEPCWDRTSDPQLKRLLLYQLS